MSTDDALPLQRLSARECHALLQQGYVFLDVRSVPEFDSGHPEGAYNIPWQQPGAEGMVDNEQFLATVQRSFPHTQGLVIGCRTGNRSQQAARLLLRSGYAAVVEQRSGFAGARDAFGQVRERGWQDEGLPTSQHPLPGRDYASLSSR